ncbi:MAG: ATP-binding cassette, subfamily bacterial [Frankiales bacterium]|jgi:ABC-type multidrug transport system fused ATPase/permease subunit|nr:ATP-binding cassette, subfamily bacterial [Frankiales bacterium]
MDAPPRTPRQVIWRGLWILRLAVREEPRIFAVSAVGSALFGGMTIAQAYAFGHITSTVIEPSIQRGDTTTASLAGAVLLVMGVATLKVFGILGRRLGAGIMQYRLQATYRKRVTRRYLELPLEWHQQHPTGELLSNANSDVEATWYPIAPFPFAVGVVFMLIGTLALLFFTDPVLAVVGSIIFPAIAILTVVYSSRMSPLMTRAQQLRGEVSTIAHESFDGALVVKTLGRESFETDRFTAKSRELRDTLVQVGRVRGLFDPIMEALPVIGVLLVLVVGTSRVGSGHLSSGDLVRVAYLFTLLAFPVRAIGWVLNELPRSVVGYDRVLRVLEAEGQQHFGTAEPAVDGAVTLDVRDLSFAYGDDQVLHQVCFDVAPGRTVAVVGPTGSGKSTLATLLVRLVDPLSGVVEYDGTDVAAFAPGRLATIAALAPQTTFLFDDTVRGNVTLGADISDEQVWAALRVAQADGFVAALGKGLDTVVGERGTTLSGGQRQRLALARAVARNPRLLVLDDATSSVDPSVEQRILAGLRGSASASTVVVVAYRRATIALADEVVFVDEGRLVDRGTHDELRERCAGYRDLVTAYERAEAEREAEHAGDESEAVR